MDGQPILPPGTPSHAQQQWGVIISIVIIVMMIVVGAFYSWGKRLAQQNALNAAISATTTGQQSF